MKYIFVIVLACLMGCSTHKAIVPQDEYMIISTNTIPRWSTTNGFPTNVRWIHPIWTGSNSAPPMPPPHASAWDDKQGYVYHPDGKTLDSEETQKVIELINSGKVVPVPCDSNMHLYTFDNAMPVKIPLTNDNKVSWLSITMPFRLSCFSNQVQGIAIWPD